MPKICYEYKAFNAAHTAKIDTVNEIIEEYAAQGFDLTLRQLYYQLVARDYIPNNIREYKNLGTLVGQARMAGLIDWESIIDRVRSLERLPAWPTPASIISSSARSFRMDRWVNQAYRVEVWVEKNAAVGIIEPICRRLDIPYFACIGYTSITAIWEAAQRLKGYIQDDQIPVILHLGDHDPSGIDMTRDIRERLTVFLSQDCDSEYIPWDGYLEVDRLALNMNQVRQYNPPPNPAKLTDSRATGYIAQYGDDSWELDALSPSVVSELIENAVNEYVDESLWDITVEKEETGKELLQKTSTNWPLVVKHLETL